MGDNNLKLTDINRLTDVFTYYNNAGTATSWIDYVVCSSRVDSMVSSCSICYEVVSSDHKPLFVSYGFFPVSHCWASAVWRSW